MAHFMTVLGVWLGAFFTLCIFSFLYKDNPFYKLAEQIFVGLSAGYWFIYTIYSILIPNLFTKLQTDFSRNTILLIPGILGVMMLLRLIPKLEWLSLYPISLVIGTSAGISILRYMKSDVLSQLTATMMNPLKQGSIDAIICSFILDRRDDLRDYVFLFQSQAGRSFGCYFQNWHLVFDDKFRSFFRLYCNGKNISFNRQITISLRRLVTFD